MSAGLKKLLNRGGLVAVIIGIAGITIGGGDTGSAIELAGTVVGIVGTVMVLIREIGN